MQGGYDEIVKDIDELTSRWHGLTTPWIHLPRPGASRQRFEELLFTCCPVTQLDDRDSILYQTGVVTIHIYIPGLWQRSDSILKADFIHPVGWFFFNLSCYNWLVWSLLVWHSRRSLLPAGGVFYVLNYSPQAEARAIPVESVVLYCWKEWLWMQRNWRLYGWDPCGKAVTVSEASVACVFRGLQKISGLSIGLQKKYLFSGP